MAMAGVAVTMWAASYPWSKAILMWLDPIASAGARYSAAAIVLIALTVGSGQLAKVFLGNWKSYLLIGFVGFTIYPLLIFTGLTFTSTMNASVIMALSPVMTMVGAALFLGERLTARAGLGLAISVAGAVIAVLGDSPKGLAGFTLDQGEPLVMIGAACLSFYTVASRKLLSVDVPPMINTALVITSGAVLLLPVVLVFGKVPETPPSTEVILALLAIVVGSTVLGYVFWMRATQALGVDTPNLMFNFIPVLTMAFAWSGGTPPFPEQIIGAALVIAGVTIAASKRGHTLNHAA
jgi:drug/metabolite transporter (DMT)-like permease